MPPEIWQGLREVWWRSGGAVLDDLLWKNWQYFDAFNWAIIIWGWYFEKIKMLITFLRFYGVVFIFLNFLKRKKFSFICGQRSSSIFWMKNSFSRSHAVFDVFEVFWQISQNASKNVQKQHIIWKMNFWTEILMVNVDRTKEKTFFFWKKSEKAGTAS